MLLPVTAAVAPAGAGVVFQVVPRAVGEVLAAVHVGEVLAAVHVGEVLAAVHVEEVLAAVHVEEVLAAADIGAGLTAITVVDFGVGMTATTVVDIGAGMAAVTVVDIGADTATVAGIAAMDTAVTALVLGSVWVMALDMAGTGMAATTVIPLTATLQPIVITLTLTITTAMNQRPRITAQHPRSPQW